MSYDVTLGTAAKPKPSRTSELLREFAASLAAERVTIGEIVAALGDRGLGVLIAIFALPNILPSTVPFGNVLTGVPPLIFAAQLMFGFDRLILPRFLARLTVRTQTLKVLAPKVAAVLSWFERLLTPRLSWVTGPYAERAFGFVCVVLSVIAMLPIPFGHNLPALGLVLIGLGLIERDGLAILLGAAIGVIGAVLLVLVVFGLAHGLGFILRDLGLGATGALP
jgi:hypothetical protein